MVTIFNNTLIIEDFYIKDFEQKEQEYLRLHFGQQAYNANAKTELEQMIKRLPLTAVTQLINIEESTYKIVIARSPELNSYIAYYQDHGLCGPGLVTNIIVAINKAYCNMLRAEKMAKYLKALGFGIHRELVE